MSERKDKPTATEQMVPLVYQELRAVARRYFQAQRPGFTLHPTELVNEACLHLLQHAPGPWDDAEHFRAIATRKIWQVIVDHLRQRQAAKRGGKGKQRLTRPGVGRADVEPSETDAREASSQEVIWQRIPLEAIRVEWHDRQVELIDLAEALEALAKHHTRLYEVVVLHWFAGIRHADVARLLDVSQSTIEKDFRYALAWLNRRLEGGGGGGK